MGLGVGAGVDAGVDAGADAGAGALAGAGGGEDTSSDWSCGVTMEERKETIVVTTYKIAYFRKNTRMWLPFTGYFFYCILFNLSGFKLEHAKNHRQRNTKVHRTHAFQKKDWMTRLRNLSYVKFRDYFSYAIHDS